MKNEGQGLIAWSTRGPLGIDSPILATTVFQHKFYKKNELLNLFIETFHFESKTIEYIKTRLRSAKDIYLKGGHVTKVYRDQQIRMHFYNKRLIQIPLAISKGRLKG
jgi:hypothetical protein